MRSSSSLEHSLEDVVTHVLRNAQRPRRPGTPIQLRAEADAQTARVAVHNVGAPIPEALLERIFEYGVSEPAVAPDEPGCADAAPKAGQRGQGLSWPEPTWPRWAEPSPREIARTASSSS